MRIVWVSANLFRRFNYFFHFKM